MSHDPELIAIVKGFLDCPEIAECAAEDKDPETDALERRARAVLDEAARPAPGGPAMREGWRPIETAPKERGAEILGWCVYPLGAEVRLCKRTLSGLGAPGWFAFGCWQNVTHWMPLPAPPEPLVTEAQASVEGAE